MIVYLNGRFMAEEQAVISIHDRGFLYGDGLFEALRVYNGEPFLWNDHITRFQRGCEVLQISCPLTGKEIRQVLGELLRRNQLKEALVRFTLSRGSGLRGYSPRGAEHPTFVLTPFHAPELPKSYQVIVSTVRLPSEDAIAAFKHLNKVHQIIARSEADAAGAHEALLTNTEDFVIEGSTTNLFWVEGKTVCTPPIQGILAGTTRAHVIRLCDRLGLGLREKYVRRKELAASDGVFVTSCAAELMEVSHLHNQPLKRSRLIHELRKNFRYE